MYNFYVIEGKKLINYKPGYEQYTRAFTRVEEELEQKAGGNFIRTVKKIIPGVICSEPEIGRAHV